MITNETQPFAFLNGGGEMGVLIRTKDWSKTTIGTPDTWPQGLRTAVSILLNSQFPMFVWWGQELTTIYNDAYIPIAGEKHPDLLGKSGKDGWAEIWKDLSPLVESVFNGISTWSEDQVLYMNRRGYTEETYFTFSYSPILDELGKVAGLFCACIETTDKVLATRRIQESERNLRNTILQSPVAMAILKGPTFIVEIANERMFELWGRNADALLHQPFFEALPEAGNQGFEELLQGVLKTGIAFAANEHSIVLPRGNTKETLYVNFVYEPFKEGDGAISGVLVVASDVTEQVMARHKVEESEERTRLAVTAAHLGTYDVNLESQTIIYSDRLAEIFGLDKSKPWPYQVWVNSVHPDDVSIRSAAYELARQTGELFYEVRIILPDQSIRWIRLNGKYMFKEGAPVSLVGTAMDITEERKASETMEQKIEERTKELKQVNDQLKQFTYAASHDLQEPLRKISFFLDRLLVNIGPGLNEDNKKIADRILHTTGRMRTLIDDLLAYSNTALGITGFKPVDLNSIVKDVLTDMEATLIEKGAEINLQGLPQVKGDQRQLRQLFQNLISNALKYHKADNAPQVQITYELVTGEETEAYIAQERKAEKFYEIKVSDNGIGFDQDDAERIFRLFQRLHGKSEYEGTGVGLAIVQKVIENHNGYIWAEGEPGKGATFNILLPVDGETN